MLAFKFFTEKKVESIHLILIFFKDNNEIITYVDFYLVKEMAHVNEFFFFGKSGKSAILYRSTNFINVFIKKDERRYAVHKYNS